MDINNGFLWPSLLDCTRNVSEYLKQLIKWQKQEKGIGKLTDNDGFTLILLKIGIEFVILICNICNISNIKCDKRLVRKFG